MLLENFSTDRLYFRKLEDSDAPLLLEFFLDEEATRYITYWNDPYEMPMARIKGQQERYEKDGDGLCAMVDKESGAFVGQGGLLWQEVDGVRELEVGYHLQPTHWKKGYATEAAKGCRDFAFEQGLANSIISIIKTDNIPSIRVAERNGMRLEKEADFKGFEVYIFRITRAEWAGLKD